MEPADGLVLLEGADLGLEPFPGLPLLDLIEDRAGLFGLDPGGLQDIGRRLSGGPVGRVSRPPEEARAPIRPDAEDAATIRAITATAIGCE
ncbi:MAG: hypothetical protein U0800_24995 [Isosphaeraceae bacterium]